MADDIETNGGVWRIGLSSFGDPNAISVGREEYEKLKSVGMHLIPTNARSAEPPKENSPKSIMYNHTYYLADQEGNPIDLSSKDEIEKITRIIGHEKLPF